MTLTNALPRSVVHISPTYFDERSSMIGGGERAPVELAKAMAKLVPTELISFGKKGRIYREDDLTYRIYRPPFYIDNNAANPFDVRFLAPLMRHSIIHVHQISTVISNLSCLIGVIPRYRLFATDHGGGGRDYGRFLPLKRLVRAHLAVTEFAGTHSPLKDNRVVPIYLGVDTVKYRPGSEQRKPFILFVGRLLPHKGVDALIEAVPQGVELVVVGRSFQRKSRDKSPYVVELERMARGRKVRFVADATDAEIVSLYQKATVTVLPSVYNDMYGGYTPVPELLGLVLLESMACGTPVVCTNVGGMPEVVKDGETGIVVPPNNPQALREALTVLLANPERRAYMGKAAHRHVLDRYTWDAVAQRCLSAYTVALETTTKAPDSCTEFTIR